MKRILTPVLAFLAVFVVVSAIGHLGGCRSAHADTGSAVATAGSGSAIVAVQPSGSGSAVTVTTTTVVTPADAVHDPVSQPAATFDDVKAAKQVSWPAAVFIVVLIVAKLLGRAKSVAQLAWLGKGRVAVVVAGAAAVAAAAFNVAIAHGSAVAILSAVVVASAAYWNSHGSDTLTITADEPKP